MCVRSFFITNDSLSEPLKTRESQSTRWLHICKVFGILVLLSPPKYVIAEVLYYLPYWESKLQITDICNQAIIINDANTCMEHHSGSQDMSKPSLVSKTTTNLRMQLSQYINSYGM